MPGFIGRKIIFNWNGAPVEGVREKGIALNGEPIDVTDDDSDGWRMLLEEAGENQIDISISGVTKDQILMKDWFDGTRTRTATLTYPDGRIISGTFFLATYNDTGPYNDATTFEAELQSSREAAYTPSP